jgi:subtilisin family serine protease
MVAVFSIDKLHVDATSYNTIDGTSMATPAVAGLATMLRAYNPSFTYTDVVNTIKNSGTTTSSLSGKSTTGKAVNAMSALAYINRPTGLAATVQ